MYIWVVHNHPGLQTIAKLKMSCLAGATAFVSKGTALISWSSPVAPHSCLLWPGKVPDSLQTRILVGGSIFGFTLADHKRWKFHRRRHFKEFPSLWRILQEYYNLADLSHCRLDSVGEQVLDHQFPSDSRLIGISTWSCTGKLSHTVDLWYNMLLANNCSSTLFCMPWICWMLMYKTGK